MKYLISVFLFIISVLNISLAQNDIEVERSNAKEQKVLINTEYGNILLKLYNETPMHRDNFIKLIKENYYDNLLFHRVINEFMIQGGDPDSKWAEAGDILGNGGPGYTIPAEFHPGLFHKRGALASARTNNPEKASSGSQFYIVQGRVFNDSELQMLENRMGIKFPDTHKKVYKTLGGYPPLDQNYTVFGEVIEGMDVVEKVAGVAADRANRPMKDISMTIKIIN